MKRSLVGCAEEVVEESGCSVAEAFEMGTDREDLALQVWAMTLALVLFTEALGRNDENQ